MGEIKPSAFVDPGGSAKAKSQAKGPSRAEIEGQLAATKEALAKLPWGLARAPDQEREAERLERLRAELETKLGIPRAGAASSDKLAAVQERLKAMNEAAANEKMRATRIADGKLGNEVANFFTSGAWADAAAGRDKMVENVNALHQRLLARDGGVLSQKSCNLLGSAIDGAMSMIETVGEIRSGTVKNTVNTAAALGLVVAGAPAAVGAVFSGGAAAASLGELAVYGTVVAAGVRVPLHAAMEGSNYDDSLRDSALSIAQGSMMAAQGFHVDKAASAIGNKVADVVHSGVTATKMVSNEVAQKIAVKSGQLVAGGVNSGVPGGVFGGVGSAVEQALAKGNWDEGLVVGAKRVLGAFEHGVAVGTVAGVAVGAAMNVNGHQIPISAPGSKPVPAPPQAAVPQAAASAPVGGRPMTEDEKKTLALAVKTLIKKEGPQLAEELTRFELALEQAYGARLPSTIPSGDTKARAAALVKLYESLQSTKK